MSTSKRKLRKVDAWCHMGINRGLIEPKEMLEAHLGKPEKPFRFWPI
jgi:hypothetical protein